MFVSLILSILRVVGATPFTDPINLPDGPPYADVAEVTFSKGSSGNYTISMFFYGYLPLNADLSGIVYIDQDSLPETGCRRGGVFGADYAVLFDVHKAALYSWKNGTFMIVGGAPISLSGNRLELSLSPKYFNQASRAKLFAQVVFRDPLKVARRPFSSLGKNLTAFVVDDRDDLPSWCDVKSISLRLRKGVLEVCLKFFGYPLPKLKGDGIMVYMGYSLYIDRDGNSTNGWYGAEYGLRLQLFRGRGGAFKGLYVAGFLEAWDEHERRWRPLFSFPGFIMTDEIIYDVPIRYLNLTASARLFSLSSPWIRVVDYVPDNYFTNGWLWGRG